MVNAWVLIAGQPAKCACLAACRSEGCCLEAAHCYDSVKPAVQWLLLCLWSAHQLHSSPPEACTSTLNYMTAGTHKLHVQRLASLTLRTLLMLRSTTRRMLVTYKHAQHVDLLHAYCLHPCCPQPTYCLCPTSYVLSLGQASNLRLRQVYKDTLASHDAGAPAWLTR